jgi:hypothetical protein
MIDHSRRRFDGDAADAAIDRAVREIMSSDAPPGFRQRVLARLDDRPRGAWAWGRVGLVASAAALVMLLAMWPRTERTPNLPVTPPPPAAAPQRAAVPVSPPTATTPTTTPGPPPERRTDRAIARRSAPASAERRVTAAAIDAAEEAVERGAATTARPSVDATGAPPLQIRPLEIPEIVVKPVTIGPIVVVPLPPPRR